MTSRSVALALLCGVFVALAGVAARGVHGGRPRDAAAPGFDAVIRPILSENCFQCHGVDQAKRAADLRLDERESAIAHGALVPFGVARSELIRRIRSEDPRTRMPPPDSHRSLDESQKRALERWIASGAEYEPHWAFVVPRAVEMGEGENPIDAIVATRLGEHGCTLAPEADRRTLLRRASLDLIGLPPTPEELAAFEADASPDAWSRVVERLLASPHYGERMALPWLDAARYADSNGFQQDGDTFQWVWRDWLVGQLNRDTPYDRLSTLMLAGDLLPDADDESRLATAFLRNHLLNGEGGAIPEENRWVSMFDRVDATATTWLGLTMSCAQCHDHKFDPITQRDYYALLDGFNRVPETGIVAGAASRFRIAAPAQDAPSDTQRARRAELEAALAGIPEDEARKAERDAARGALDRFLADEWPRVMVMSDAQPRETPILVRGDYLSPGETVAFATPAFLPPRAADAPANRLGLARWLFAAENPLVARVAVNRAWQTFFGEGIVRTPEDFGVQGDRPVLRELLDTLAVRLRDDGWSMKALHRTIVTSRVYRQSSALRQELAAVDPDNRLLGRFPRHRLPSMLIRDLALASSGLLDARVGGAPVYPYQPPRVWESLAITKERDFAYPASHGADLYRRSLYTFWRRTIAPANMFDVSQRQSCRVRVALTNSPLHALVTLNDPTFVEAARALAASVMSEHGLRDERLSAAFERVVGRWPRPDETAILARMWESQYRRYEGDPGAAESVLAVGESPRPPGLDPAEHAATTVTCLAILNLDEAITRE